MDKDMFEVFGDFDPAEYAEEAEQRWGGGDEYKESMRKTSRYTKEDWKSIDENFYRCSMEVYAGLGEMYVADPRFTKNIDKAGEGLAAYMRDGIRVYVAGRR